MFTSFYIILYLYLQDASLLRPLKGHPIYVTSLFLARFNHLDNHNYRVYQV